MKILSLVRVLLLTVAILLTGSGAVLAQATNDVSQYPTNSALLPGKGVASKWNLLPYVWAKRHEEWAKTAQDDHEGVVFLGDSITQGWGPLLAQSFPGLKVVNRGIGGDTTRGVLYRLDADVLSLDPKAIVLLIGTNDLGAGGNPADAADNIKAIVKVIHHKYPRLPVIVCEVMPSSEKMGRPAAKIEKLNSLIKKDVRWHSHVYLCDTWSIYANANGDSPNDLFPDSLHPNAAGYAKWTTALKPIFAKLNLQAKD